MTSFLIAFFETEMRSWRGAEPLWKVFWVYGVLVSSVLGLFYALAMYEDRIVLQQVLLACFATYTVWILVSVWRCSDNTEEPLWGLLAQRLTVVWAGNAIMLLIFLQLGLVKTYLGF